MIIISFHVRNNVINVLIDFLFIDNCYWFLFDFSKTKAPSTNQFSKQEQFFIVKTHVPAERLAEIVDDAILDDVTGDD